VALSDARLEYAQLVERQIELLLAARVQPLHLLQRLQEGCEEAQGRVA